METFRDIGSRLSNWGRWGTEDQRGTLNLVTAERLIAAGRAITQGKVFALGIPFNSSGPGLAGGRPNPIHLMTQTSAPMGNGTAYTDDFIVMHPQCASQWDALCHFFYDNQLYNGFPADQVTVGGAGRLGIQTMAEGGVVGRGVLLDIVGLGSEPWLEIGHVIQPADLERCEREQRVRVGPGDVLCLRTGWRRRYLESGPEGWMAGEPGIGLECCDWLHDREVAAVCSDNWGVEALPSQDPGTVAPVHCVLLRDMGMPIGEILDFETLAADCRGDGIWTFLFSAPALKIEAGVGSPINPLALK